MTVEKACKKLIIGDPFWGLLLLGINRRFSEEIPTLCVSLNGIDIEVVINPKFWDSLPEPQQMAVLLHEMHHLCFGHLGMIDKFKDMHRANIATDLEVNCYIKDLPNDALLPEQFNLPERKSAIWYYNNLPGEINSNQQKAESSINKGGGYSTIDDHSQWKKINDSELAQNEINAHIVRAAQEIKGRGTIPGYLSEIVDKAMRRGERQYDWRKFFRRHLGAIMDTKLKKSYSRSSIRFPDSPGVRFSKKVSVLVGVDTSGSMDTQELEEVFSEVDYVRLGGGEVTVAQFDSDVQSVSKYTGLNNIEIKGRGGTDFTPVIDYYIKHKKEYGAFIIFTDGEAPIDDIKLRDMVWVISSDGTHKNYPGRAVYMKCNHDRDNN